MRIVALLLLLASCPSGVLGQRTSLDQADAVRIAEAYALSDFIGDAIWDGWSETPFAILLLTPEKDYLIGHPYPTEDFSSEGIDGRLGKEVFSRPRTEAWGLNLLATFPAVAGLSTVVVGRPSATGLSSTRWVLTLLHEHFHQYQVGWNDYFVAVNALDLSGGDESGMWMLNYPFPYADESVSRNVYLLRDSISEFDAGLSGRKEIAEALQRLKSSVPEKDFRYLSFQLWQEGVARYTERAVAEQAVQGFATTADFKKLPDYEPYEHALQAHLERGSRELASLELSEQGRIAFYAMGSALASVLEATRPMWRTDYFAHALDFVALFLDD